MDSQKILNEKDPYIREIWAQGYDEVQEREIDEEILLIRHSDCYVKRLNSYSFRQFLYGLKIITGYSSVELGSVKHKWISSADGSCERFIELIKPEK